MIGDAQEVVMDSDSLLKKLLIGSVLLIFSIFILPFVMILGYLVRTIGNVEQGEGQLPSWREPLSLLVDGLKALGVFILFTTPFFLISSIPMGTLESAVGWFVGLSIVYWGLIFYLVPAILRELATDTRFSPKQVLKDGFTFGYAGLLGWAFIVNLIAQILSLVLTFTIIGIIAIPVILFWHYVMIAIMTGIYFQQVKT